MKISLQDNVVTIAVIENASIDLGAIPAEIARVGYTPAEMTVRAVGMFGGDSTFAGFALSKPVHPAPDTKVEVRAAVDYSQPQLVWTIVKVGP